MRKPRKFPSLQLLMLNWGVFGSVTGPIQLQMARFYALFHNHKVFYPGKPAIHPWFFEGWLVF